jgi:hypothetical protein
MKSILKISTVLLIFLSMNFIACTKKEGSPQAAVTSISVADSDVITAKKDNGAYIIINLYPNKDLIAQAGPDKGKKLIIDAAIESAKKVLKKEKYKAFSKATIDPVYVESFDEYGQHDFSSVVQLGTIVLAKEAEALKLVSESLKIK